MTATIFAGRWAVLGAFTVKAAAVMLLIALAAVATPYIAKLIDKHRKPKDVMSGSEDGVRGIFDASRDEDFDPNYKIYNTDIYGFDKKSERNDNDNGKEQ